MHHFLQLRNDSAYHHRFPTPPAKSPSRTHRTPTLITRIHICIRQSYRGNQRYGIPHTPQSSPVGDPSSNRKQQSPHDTQSPSPSTEKSGAMSNDIPGILIHIPVRTPAAESTGMDAYARFVERAHTPAAESPAHHQHTTNTPPAPQRHLTGIPNPSNRGRL